MKHFLLILFALMGERAGAEAISFGLRGGLPFGDGFKSIQTQSFSLKGHQSFLLGPTVELRLPLGFGASFDFLYRRIRSENVTTGQENGGGQWEFPFMARYRLPGVVAHPYIAAGPVFYKVTGLPSFGSTSGIAFGAGVDVKVPLIRLTPELRYQRRFNDKTIGGLPQNLNQVDLMLGVTF